jgi:putative selenate reductase
VAAHGPASIVRAAADGKRAAAAILASFGSGIEGPGDVLDRTTAPGSPESGGPAPGGPGSADLHGLVLRRARREYRVPIRSTPPDERSGFAETTLGYTADEAECEAGRCLDCDVLCSLCAGVCPNLAILTYQVGARRHEVPVLTVAAGAGWEADGSTPFAVEQGYQVAVLTDLCNECGNCVTACPTAGTPYRDKPRLYLDRADFEAQTSNAFLLVGGGAIEGRFDGATHRLAERDGRLAYRGPGLEATLDAASLSLLEVTGSGPDDGGPPSLEPAAVMATLLDGISRSLPHLPVVSGPGTRVRPDGRGPSAPSDG